MYFSQPSWQDNASKFKQFNVYPWMEKIKNRTDIFCSFWCHWATPDLPNGYDYYLVTYHIETVNLDWIKKQQVDGKIIVVFPGKSYGLEFPNVEFIGYTELHNDLHKMIDWFGVQDTNQNKKYKFSTICNRVSQGKIWTTTQILESEPNSLLILNTDWIEDKNVHNWTPCGVKYLDNLTNTFKNKYIDKKIVDDFNNETDNNQRKNSNPWQPYYTDSALHIVAGSFHYSFMDNYIYPGPDIDEKTLKCLLAGIPFLPAMQFDVYNYLSIFGLNFDYKFDTSFDSDPGNLTRFEKLCKLIDKLSKMEIEEIVQSTSDATNHNREHILNGTFAKTCNEYNQQQVEKIFKALK